MISAEPISTDSVDPHDISDSEGVDMEWLLYGPVTVAVLIDYGRIPVIDRDPYYYEMMAWCEEMIGPKGQQWGSGGYRGERHDIFLFLKEVEATAFRLRFHGMPE